MTGFAVVNPRSAGGRTRRDWPLIEAALRAAYPELEIAMTRKRGDATELVREALREGHSEIIAIGGDGTINEAVNGFFDEDGSIAPDAVFGFVTSGTGGDFRRSFDCDPGHVAAIARLRNFVNIGSFGLSGVIVDWVNRARVAKLFGGAFAFAFHSARAMLFYRERMVRIRIDGDFDEIASIATVAVANGRYFGGGMHVAPRALPDDGVFDVIIMGGGRRAISDLKLLYTGEHIDTPGVRALRGRKIMAAPVAETGGHAVLIEVDGESTGRLPATFEILPRALNLRC
jgi:diacylglycerol kinase (ATP)